MRLVRITLFCFLFSINAQADLHKSKHSSPNGESADSQNYVEVQPVVSHKKFKINKIISQTVGDINSSTERNEVKAINSETDKKNAEVVRTYLKSKNMGITDYTSTFDVLTGTTLKGIILNSIVSSNLESPIVVQVTYSNCDIPVDSKLICVGFTRGKRVSSACTRLISNLDEYEINASLLNLDGTAGLTGEVFTGKEEMVLGALVGGALSAALDVSRDRVSTATGELATNSARNKVLSLTMGGLDQGVQILSDEAKTKEAKVTIQAGTEVLIFINQRFKI
jgi:hypothetical protein